MTVTNTCGGGSNAYVTGALDAPAEPVHWSWTVFEGDSEVSHGFVASATVDELRLWTLRDTATDVQLAATDLSGNSVQMEAQLAGSGCASSVGGGRGTGAALLLMLVGVLRRRSR